MAMFEENYVRGYVIWITMYVKYEGMVFIIIIFVYGDVY